MTVEVVQHFINRNLCLAAEAAFPAPDWQYWHRYQGRTANKYGSMDRSRIPVACLAALDALAIKAAPYIGDSFIDYDLHAAGCHMLPPGGFLASHYDAECHPIRKWRRTHSIVLCVTSNWREQYGGQLYIDDEGTYSPQFGTAIIFDTPNTRHEVLPVALDSPLCRKTLALFAWRADEDCEGMTAANFGEH